MIFGSMLSYSKFISQSFRPVCADMNVVFMNPWIERESRQDKETKGMMTQLTYEKYSFLKLVKICSE